MPTNSVTSLTISSYAANLLLARIKQRLSDIFEEILVSDSSMEFDRAHARQTALLRVERLVKTEVNAVATKDADQHETALLHAEHISKLLKEISETAENELIRNMAKRASDTAAVDAHVRTERYIIWALQAPVELPKWAVEILTSEKLI